MRVEVKADIKEVTKGLDGIPKNIVPRSTHAALKRAVSSTYSEAVKAAAKDFKLTQKKVKQKKIIDRVTPKYKEKWGAVWLNKYRDSMSVEKFYTIGDANSRNASPRPGVSVKGAAFTFQTKNQKNNLFAKREASKNRIDNVWKSSKLHTLYYHRTLTNAKALEKSLTIKARAIFLNRFNHEVGFRLKKAGFN